METELKIEGLNKAFGNLQIFRDFSITFPAGKINCILGPSGCGKTTLLNIMCGNEKADFVNNNGFTRYRFSYVFQDARLLPWKTVFQNLEFTLKDSVAKDLLYKTVTEYLELVELEKFRHYFPKELSGGMKQRLSLARAFSFPSDIILMDEPFKALDIKLKKNLINRFYKLWEKDRRTVIFVTHDVDEALELGQEIYLFSDPPVRVLKNYEKGDTRKLRAEIMELLYDGKE